MKRIVVHIDRLVLRGFRPGDRHAVAEGLQDELSRLLVESASSIAERGGLARLSAGSVRIGPSAKPQQMGVQAAREITRGIQS